MRYFVFCDVAPCGSYKNRRFVEISPYHLILFTLIMEAMQSETTVLTRATLRHIPEDAILRVTECSLLSACAPP
jgi:hypothetical protein